MWRTGSSSGAAASTGTASTGSKMRTSGGSSTGWGKGAKGSPPASPFKKTLGPGVPNPGRGDLTVYGPDNYKYPYAKDSSG